MAQLHNTITSIESKVDRAEEKGGECITLTLDEVYALIDKLNNVFFDIGKEKE